MGVGLASLFSDLSHETATAVLPALIASIGASAAALGVIEGVADAVSSFAKIGGGWWSDRLRRRKPLAVAGYALTTLAMGALALAHNRFLVAVALFGAGDFAKSMLILLVMQSLTPTLGAAKAASVALWLYVVHKIFYMGCSYPAGHLGDKFDKRKLLVVAYALAAVMGVLLMFAPKNLPVLVA